MELRLVCIDVSLLEAADALGEVGGQPSPPQIFFDLGEPVLEGSRSRSTV